ncbi:MAG: hypothetical protein J6T10_18690 [Methanobrevibacter sp.]|nr:hypothetical protein [Methanobrevibacter sp.]
MKTLIDLLTQFTPWQIILFIILLAVAFKEVSDFVDWFKQKTNKRDESLKMDYEMKQENEERLDRLETNMDKLTENVDNMTGKIDLLVSSDRDAIKAFITREHHYFCYKVGWIDDYSLDCLEHRFQHYQEEHGNSFIEGLMNELRALPKTEPKKDE